MFPTRRSALSGMNGRLFLFEVVVCARYEVAARGVVGYRVLDVASCAKV